jgi:hypothetical protein
MEESELWEHHGSAFLIECRGVGLPQGSASSKTAVVYRDGFRPTIEVMRAGHRRGGVATGNLTRDPSEEK